MNSRIFGNQRPSRSRDALISLPTCRRQLARLLGRLLRALHVWDTVHSPGVRCAGVRGYGPVGQATVSAV